MPKKSITKSKTPKINIIKSDGALIPKAFDYLSCNVADLENQISFLDEELDTVINKERPDLAKTGPRDNLCDLASDVLVLADRIYDVTSRLRNIRDNLEL